MITDRQIQTVSFAGSVAAQSKKTLVSQRITAPFKTKRIRAAFAAGTNRTLRLSFFISPDASAPTDAQPNGQNILAALGQVGYIVGNDEKKTLEHESITFEGGVWLKVFADNLDDFVHTIDSQITIEFVDELQRVIAGDEANEES